MSFWDRIFMGRVIKDFGVLEEKSFVIDREDEEKPSSDSLPKLRQCLEGIESISSQRSPAPPSAPKTEGIVPRR